MELEDLAVFTDLPAEIVAYRGCSGVTIGKAKYGMSWTLDQSRAIWFAKRPPQRGEPICIRARVRKANVLAYLHETGRREQEIVVAPGRVSQVEAISVISDRKVTLPPRDPPAAQPG
jgi:hypothetical protein